MNPLNPFTVLGALTGKALATVVGGIFDAMMRAIWEGSLAILRAAFQLADNFSIFTVSTQDGPVGVLWPVMLWVSGILALGLFFWQITITMLRGGKGFTRLVSGPAQYGVALAVTTGMVAAFLVGADAITDTILRYSLQAHNFSDAVHSSGFLDANTDGIKAVVIGLAGLVGVIPAGIGYVIEMLFREAAIYVLVATIPLTAAGLLANVTSRWFWRAVRWLLAAIAMKPVLALTLVLGIAIAGGAQGLSGLLAGIGVLLISLIVPLVLFRLFAFVDPNTDAGSAFRDQLSSAGVDSYGAGSPTGKAADAATGGLSGRGDAESSSSSDQDSQQEQAHMDRFDTAATDTSQDGNGTDALDAAGVGHPATTDPAPGDSGPDSPGDEATDDQQGTSGDDGAAADDLPASGDEPVDTATEPDPEPASANPAEAAPPGGGNAEPAPAVAPGGGEATAPEPPAPDSMSAGESSPGGHPGEDGGAAGAGESAVIA